MEGNVPSLCSGDPRLAGFNACSLFMATEKTARPAAGRTITAVVDDIGTWQRTAEGRPEQRASLSLGNNRVDCDDYPDFSGRLDKCELCCIGLPGFSQMSGRMVAGNGF